jgi:hypothetical protein
MTKQQQEIGRIALRAEGDMWNGYWAPRQDTMDGALLLASIRLSAVGSNHPDRKLEFIELVQRLFADAVQDSIGQQLTWNDPKPAPERERSGSA